MAELELHLYYESEYSQCLRHSYGCCCHMSDEDLIGRVIDTSMPHTDEYRWIRTMGESRIKLVKPQMTHYIVV